MFYVNHFIFIIVIFYEDPYGTVSHSFVFLCRPLLILYLYLCYYEKLYKMKKENVIIKKIYILKVLWPCSIIMVSSHFRSLPHQLQVSSPTWTNPPTLAQFISSPLPPAPSPGNAGPWSLKRSELSSCQQMDRYYINSKLFVNKLKGTLMQIWKSSYMFVFI